jgi:hypothetical protein
MTSYFFSLYESAYFYLTTKAEIEHHEQQFDWDCGHTCLTMVIYFCDMKRDISDAQNDLFKLTQQSQKPLWTIDLFVFLMEQGVGACFHTLCPRGVAAHHEAMEWYQRTGLAGDARRVGEQFRRASEEEWPVLEVGEGGVLAAAAICYMLYAAAAIYCCCCSMLCDICYVLYTIYCCSVLYAMYCCWHHCCCCSLYYMLLLLVLLSVLLLPPPLTQQGLSLSLSLSDD